MQQELLCERQAMRLPCPEHTSSVHLLTEDGVGGGCRLCSGGARATDHGWARTKGRSEGGYHLTSLETQVSSQRRPKATATVQTLLLA